jgi:hypothetical protein
VDFYLFQVRRGVTVLYSEGERIDPLTHEELKSDFANPVDQFLRRLGEKKGRFWGFIRNLTVTARDTYYSIEEKLDPMERVFKLMRHARQLHFFHSPKLPQSVAVGEFNAILNRHRKKHTFWTAVDLTITVTTILLSPVLVPLPGPNILFYYPTARTISHFLARRGTFRGASLRTEPTPLPEIAEIESLLSHGRSAPEFDKIDDVARALRLKHLVHFLKRYA